MATGETKISSTGDHQNSTEFMSSFVRCRKVQKKRSSIPRKKKVESNSIPSLPDDIVLEILYRLPVKSILRFRCVSKRWNSLVSSRQFSKSHHQLSNKCIMLRTSSRFLVCSVYTLLHEPIVDASVGDLKSSAFFGDLRSFRKKIFGSYNGIICLVGTHKEDELILWNPSTRQSLQVPKAPPFPEDSIRNGSMIAGYNFGPNVNYIPKPVFVEYAFGFDKSEDDCKVVRFCFGADCAICDARVSIYSMRTGQWKRIESYRGSRIELTYTKFGNGRIHWIVDKMTKNWGIAYLDLETEKYGIVQKPTTHHANGAFSVKLDVPEGCLYALCCTELSGDVWSFNGYGSGGDETWTKLVTIPHTEFKVIWNQVFQVMENGEILLKYDGSAFVIFNIVDCSFRYPKLQDSRNESISDSITYIPSLVSPFSG